MIFEIEDIGIILIFFGSFLMSNNNILMKKRPLQIINFLYKWFHDLPNKTVKIHQFGIYLFIMGTIIILIY